MRAEGIIRNVNTIEEFKNADKNAIINTAGKQVCYPHVTLKAIDVKELTLSDLGCDTGWHHILLTISPLFLHDTIVCRP